MKIILTNIYYYLSSKHRGKKGPGIDYRYDVSIYLSLLDIDNGEDDVHEEDYEDYEDEYEDKDESEDDKE